MSPAARWSASAGALAIAAILALALRESDPVQPVPWLPRCALHELTRLHCPGCGNTRASRALLNGRFAEAARQNLFTVAVLPFLGLVAFRHWLRWVMPGRFERPWLPFRWRWGYSLALLALYVAFGVLRNVPQEPYSRLAPVPVDGVNSRPSAAPLAPGQAAPPPTRP
jgi:hypothetical protein